MIIAMVLVSLLLIFFASMFSKGKGAAFLAGYNTMSDD